MVIFLALIQSKHMKANFMLKFTKMGPYNDSHIWAFALWILWKFPGYLTNGPHVSKRVNFGLFSLYHIK